MRVPKWLRVTLAVVALSAVTVAPAVAHDAQRSRSGMIGGISGQCTQGGVTQDHTWHYIVTYVTNCSNQVQGWFAQYQEVYKSPGGGQPGTFCFSEGWFQSPAKQNSFARFYGDDMWGRCNLWPNPYTFISVDSWQYSWTNDYVGWVGGAWRPATFHCHGSRWEVC